MQIRVQCSCGRAFSVAETQAGQMAFCPMCGVQCMVPATEGGGPRKAVLVAGGAVLLAAGGLGAWWFFGRTAEDAGTTNGQGGPSMHFTEGPGAGTPRGTGGPVSPTPRDPGPRNPAPTPTGLPADVAKRAGELIAELKSGDEYVRARAARDLVEMGPEIEPLLRDAAGRGVTWASLVLRAFAWRRVLPVELQVKYAPQIASLNADGDATRRQVIEAWITANDPGCSPMLADLIEDESSIVRVAALKAAVLFRAPVTGAGIAKVMEDPGDEVLGVLAAGLLGVSEAAPRIRPLLGGADREGAVVTLGLLRDGESAAEIVKDTADPNARVRAHAYEALGRIGRFPGGFPIDAIRDPDPEVRAAVLIAAGRCGEASLQNSISQLLADSDPRMRRAGAEALGALGQDTAIPNLMPLLADTDPGVRYETARALGRLRHRPAVSTIVGLLDDRAVAKEASDDAALRSLLGSMPILTLRRTLPVPEGREVREGALLALEQATGERFEGDSLDERLARAREWWTRKQPEYPR